MSRIEKWQLKQRQGYDLDVKIQMTLQKIQNFYDAFDGKIYVAYSGGKDSEVLLHLAKQIDKN